MEKGLLIVVSAPAGSGKGTVNRMVLEKAKDEFSFSVSTTTRKPRPGERDGIEYWFIDRDRFEEKIAAGEMLEYTEYCGNYYGTPKKAAEDVLAQGKNLLLEIDVVGGMNVRKNFPEAVLIMLLPPTFAEQEKRLRGRGTEPDDVIARRLERTRAELPYIREYDYVVYNRDGEAEKCAEEILGIVHAEKNAVRRHPDALKQYFGE